MDLIKRQITSAGKTVEELEPSTLLKGLENGVTTFENSLAISQKVIQSYYMTQQFHPLVYPGKMKTNVCTKSRTQMFTATLFTTAREVEAIRCPPVHEWINKAWHIHTGGVLRIHKKQ